MSKLFSERVLKLARNILNESNDVNSNDESTFAWLFNRIGVGKTKVSGDKVDISGDVNIAGIGLTTLEFK